MDPQTDKANAEQTLSPQQMQEEVAYLRRKFGSMMLRGQYKECVKEIEEHLQMLYLGERWPERFFSILRLHQKCYPSLDRSQPYDQYLAGLLQKKNIPVVFSLLIQKKDSTIVWSSDYFYNLVEESEAAGDLEEALSYSDLLLKMDPHSAKSRLLKGRILSSLNRDSEAMEQYQHVLELHPRNTQALAAMVHHLRKTNPAQALELVQKTIDDFPDDADNHGLLAELLAHVGRPDEALSALDQAMNLDPYNEAYPYQRAEILYTGGKQVMAAPHYRLALALNNQHVPSLLRLCALSTDVQPELALDYATRAATAAPDNKEALLQRAQLLSKTGKWQAAVEQYRTLLEMDAGNVLVHAGLGAAFLALQDAEAALPALTEAVRLAPANTAYRHNKARAHLLREEWEAAIAEYREILALDKSDAVAWGQLAQLLAVLEPREALQHFDRALALDPENARYYTGKADLLLQVPGQETAALDSLHLACKYDPGNAPLHVRLGRLLEKHSNFSSAMQHYKLALQLDPDNDETCYLYARLQMDTNPSIAYLWISKAIALSVTRGEYYYLKAQIIVRLRQDPAVSEKLLAAVEKEKADPNEVQQMLGGAWLHVALIYMNRAIELSPGNPVYLCMRAHLFYYLGQKPKALAQYERLLEQNPDQHEALFGKARILAEKQDERATALEYYDKAIRVAPAVAEYRAGKAALLARDPDSYAAAIEEYAAAISINNQAWRVILEKARLHDHNDDADDAMSEYRHVLLIRPDCVEATQRMGQLLADLSPQIAHVYIDHAIKLEPKNYRHYAWRAKIRFALHRLDEAHEDVETAFALGGESAVVLFTIADLLVRLQPELALAYCQRAVEANPDRPEYHLLHGDLLLNTGSPAGARAAYEQAAALRPQDHTALERRAEAAYRLAAPDVDVCIAEALASRPNCPACLFTRARMHKNLHAELEPAIADLYQALELEPDNLLFRELLVECLREKRAHIKRALEQWRLDKLRKQQPPPPVVAHPPDFDAEEDMENFF